MTRSAPLFLVSGAAGTGKTTLIPHLARLARGLAGGLVVFDLDDLLEEGGLLGIPITTPEAAPTWPAYNRLWHRLTVAVRRSGVAVLLLAPPPPPEGALEVWAADDDLRPALLDCAPGEHERRLRARGWSVSEIEDALRDAEEARRVIQPAFRSDLATPEGVARQVMSWVTQPSG